MVLRTEVDTDPQGVPIPIVASIESTLADARAALLGEGPEPSTDALTAALETERDLWESVLAHAPESAEAVEVRSLGGATTLVAALQAADGTRAMVLALRAGYGAEVPLEDSGPDDPFWYARGSALSLVWHRVRRNLTVRSVELQNALRLAAGLALARFIAGEFALSHGLWVLLATLTLTRTSVRATRGALKPALIGTLIGVTLAGLLLFLAGTNSAPYVVMMPIALFAAVLAGPRSGRSASQATFTLVVACLFSQVAPPTLELAKDRLVDVLIGACVGVAVGVAAWPRGGQAELRRAGSKCLAAAADCIDTTADWIVATGPPDALGSRLDAVRRALALYESTYAQYRSEPADNRDTTDWLIVGVVTARSANGAEAAAHWADRTRGAALGGRARRPRDGGPPDRRRAAVLRIPAHGTDRRRRPPAAGPPCARRTGRRSGPGSPRPRTSRAATSIRTPRCGRSRPGAGCGGWPTTCPAWRATPRRRRLPRRPRLTGGAARRTGSSAAPADDPPPEPSRHAARVSVLPVGRSRVSRAGTRSGFGRPCSPRTCRCSRPSLIRSITDESASVVTSPTSRFSATSRSSRRMILPERVLGSSATIMIWRGLAIGADLLGDVVAQLLDDVRRRSSPVAASLAQDHERADRLAGRLVGRADHRGLGDLRVRHQRRLDLGGRQPVARDVHDVVDPAEQPDVAVVVLLRAVAGEVAALSNRDQYVSL